MSDVPTPRRTTEIWRHPLELTLCVLIAAMATVTFCQVIARYVLQAPLSWSEELARFLLMWLSMLSAAYAFKLKAHFALNFAVDNLPAKLRRGVRLAATLAVVAFLLVFVTMSVTFVLGVGGHRAPALGIPMEVPYSSAIVGGLLMIYYVLLGLWRDVFRRPSDPAGEA